jgi:prepilin-type N-terminal cleavage/methylation domain-containing protein
MESILLLKRQNAGFTLIELIIVLAIIIVVTGIALGGQTGFNRTLSLNNAAYDIGLSIQLAQSYGLSSHATTTASGIIGNAGYGVQFDSGSPTSYSFFADTYPAAGTDLPDDHPGDHAYTKSFELVQKYNLNNGFQITKFCAGINACSDTEHSITINALAITFTRPNTETVILAKTSTDWPTTPTHYQSACVVVSSPNNDVRYLKISQTGQISMTTSCP